MARPRKFIRVTLDSKGHPVLSSNGNGQEVHGVSRHETKAKGSGQVLRTRFYRRDGDGRPVYFGSLLEAVEWAQQTPFREPLSDDRNDNRLWQKVKPDVWDSATPAQKDELVSRLFGRALHPFAETARAQAKLTGSKEKLSDCIAFWRQQKQERSRTKSHIDTVTRLFNCFVKVVGNKPVSELTKQDFVAYESWLLATGKKLTNQWKRDRIGDLSEVLRLCINKTDFPIPGNVTTWLNVFEPMPHSPARENKQPLPKEHFRALINVCDTYTAPAGDRTLDPIQFKAILLLTANCAFSNDDICRLTIGHLKLDATVPFVDFPRQKVARRIGRPIERMTPLATETVESLRTWLKQGRSYRPVFVSSNGLSWKYAKLNAAFGRAKKVAGIASFHTFKHLRNIAPTVRRDKGLPADMSETILGQSIKGTTRFYTGDADETYLLPLVAAVRDVYFRA